MHVNKAKIVVLISGRGSNMAAIARSCQAGDINAQIAAVISNIEDAAGLDVAKNLGLATHILPHRDFQNREEFDAALVRLIKPFNPDLICFAGFMRIVSPVFVGAFEGRILNIHPSLLPQHKGLNTHQRAIDAGDQEAGCSVHYVTEGLDEGDVIAQTKVPILPQDTAQSLSERVLQIEHETYIRGIKKVLVTRGFMA
jgi:phosphoribosylglycinamide formyltransferase-1